MTQISTRTHPNLSAAERRALRVTSEGSLYRIVFSELRLRRKSDGKPGVIRFALVSGPGQETPYTVRLRANGDPCRCSCPSHTRLRERDGVCAEPCKHMGMVSACAGQDQEPQAVSAPFDVEREAAELARLETAEPPAWCRPGEWRQALETAAEVERDARILKERELWD